MKEYAKVYSMLEDDVSRDIFVNRMFYSQTRKPEYIRNIVERYTDLPVSIFYRNEFELWGSKKIVIYGAGADGRRVYELLKERTDILAFCDRRCIEIRNYMDLPCMSIEECEKKTEYSCIYIIASSKYKDSIQAELQGHGVKADRIKLATDDWFIQFKDRQYFEPSIVKLGNRECMADCGAATGYEANYFLRHCGYHTSVWLFEPLEEHIQALKAKFSNYQNVHIIQAGTYNKTGTLYFNKGVDSYGGFLSEDGSEGENVKVAALDDVIPREQKVTLIKMDIEGSELEALKGAENIIERDKPRLAICIYHKPEDIVKIPIYIKKLHSSYKFYIRHYSNYDCETVLYAV